LSFVFIATHYNTTFKYIIANAIQNIK